MLEKPLDWALWVGREHISEAQPDPWHWQALSEGYFFFSLFLLFYYYYTHLFVCALVHKHRCEGGGAKTHLGRSEDRLQESLSSFYSVGPRDQTEEGHPGSQSLDLLNHLVGLLCLFCFALLLPQGLM